MPEHPQREVTERIAEYRIDRGWRSRLVGCERRGPDEHAGVGYDVQQRLAVLVHSIFGGACPAMDIFPIRLNGIDELRSVSDVVASQIVVALA